MQLSTKIRVTATKLLELGTKLQRKSQWRKTTKNRVGKTRILTASQKKEVKDFYKDYTDIAMLFPEFYTQKTGKFYPNYIADDIYYCKIDPYFNDWKAGIYLDNKCFYDNWYFKGINMPKTLAKRINGMWLIPGENTSHFLSTEQAYALIAKQDCFVKQAALSVGGKGVHKVHKGASAEEIDRIIKSMYSDIVVQEVIVQSSQMSKLNPHSVNTVRVLSLLGKDGSVKIYSSVVRMGIDESVVDNASSGGITCGIEPDGRLKPVAYAANGTRYEKHPGTGLKFDEVVIPNYDKICALVEKLHKGLPHFRLLSWDVAVDQADEPLLIEVNLYYGELEFHQLNNGPLFGDDTRKILDEVFHRQK